MIQLGPPVDRHTVTDDRQQQTTNRRQTALLPTGYCGLRTAECEGLHSAPGRHDNNSTVTTTTALTSPVKTAHCRGPESTFSA